MMRVRACALAFVLLFSCGIKAQSADTLSAQRTVVEVKKEHSPNTALLLSLLPGAGQVYNRQAWKIPIVYAALGTVGYFTYDYYRQMKTFKDEYLFRVNNNDTPRLAGYESHPTANIYNLYQSYNKNFQLFIFIDVAVYALNLIDAYVFGHLFDFEMDDNIALSVYPSLQYHPDLGLVNGMSLTIRF